MSDAFPSDELTIVPAPTQWVRRAGCWRKAHRGHRSPGWRITVAAAPELAAQQALLAEYLQTENAFPAGPAGDGEPADIRMDLSLAARPVSAVAEDAGLTDEQYRLTVGPEDIHLEAATPDGIARGIQTLRQLLSGQRARLGIPCLEITDAPALAWRGLHLDVSRHFFAAATVRRFIDLAALHKFNVFHWHLTDDQGWRLPVDGYPRLAEIAAWRDGTLVGHDGDRDQNPHDGQRHGGMYTAAELRETVSYAAARGMRVLPEVDVPGHVQALVSAYPEFGNTGRPPGVRTCWGISDSTLNLEPETWTFLDQVVETLAEFFPFRFQHFGGDEARTDEWRASPRVGARLRERGLPDDANVQALFTQFLAEAAGRRGRRVIGWDEILESPAAPADAAVMFWRDTERVEAGLDRRALTEGRPLVLANWSRTYFDLYQETGTARDFEPLAIGGELPLEDVYAWEPRDRLAGVPGDTLLGAQGQLWTEYIPTRDHLDYMAYPRACALAQVLWTGPAREPFAAFSRRLDRHLGRLDRLGVCYRPPRPPEDALRDAPY